MSSSPAIREFFGAKPSEHSYPNGWRRQWRVCAFAATLAAAIFCLDAFTRDDLAVAGLYILVLLIGSSVDGPIRRAAIILWSLICGGLAVLGYWIFRSYGAPPLAIAHLGISLTVLLVATVLLLRNQSMNSTIERSDRRYRIVFDTLAIAIWEHDFTVVVEELKRLRENGVTDIRRYVAEHPDFVIDMRRSVRITDVNATALTMMGVTSKQAFFSHLSGFLPETDDSFSECIVAIDERRPLFQTEAVVMPLNGEPRQVIVAFGLGPDATLDRVPGSILDVSHRRALETQILRTREELAESQRSSVVAAMSASIAHELNQPMSAIQSFADAATRWLSRSPPNLNEAKEALAGLTLGVEHARTVMQRVRALVGQSRIELCDVELEGLIATTVALMRREASEHGARLIIIPATEETLTIRGDRILLKQVLINLITNAIQAMINTPPDRRIVTLTLDRKGNQATIEVADSGAGWDSAEPGNVFGSFFTTKRNGMGLGLSIAKMVVERHEGSITRRNAESGGAVVDLTLPLIVERVIGIADGGSDGVQ
ncbi:signal transduction histidine kinase [Sphingobium sp. B2D3A]|uniref:sensor histidine kinase n=1 Tax=unclassified Sphingobium TaxID=2611147 RepID=UPI0022249613|nr:MULTISPECIES: ATP-binding protein [unclassified Sphingobium]MCW2338253.1 signal transduction histidine kinase [Sphingobium sp. B2D3A]MCW2384711.1 signal transduction histidine kinase [Sphingobium sp. B2D3D]